MREHEVRYVNAVSDTNIVCLLTYPTYLMLVSEQT